MSLAPYNKPSKKYIAKKDNQSITSWALTAEDSFSLQASLQQSSASHT